MYAISLTSIPPRLPRIRPVLESLLAQRPAPVAVYLYLPRVWKRFGVMSAPFEVPDGVVIHSVEVDDGPALKAIQFCSSPPILVQRLIYCDDDWIYPQGWAKALLQAGGPAEAVAASGYSLHRLKRQGGVECSGFVDIAQGFGGVSVAPEWLDLPDIAPPPKARLADDIWLSAQLARQGIGIRLCPEARHGLRPAFEDEHGLQDIQVADQTRAAVNLAALDAVTEQFGIWPPL